MADDFIGFLTFDLESYEICASEDGQRLGVMLRAGRRDFSFGLPHEHVDRLLLEIRKAADLCADRRRGTGGS